jgi:hypothetical protein
LDCSVAASAASESPPQLHFLGANHQQDRNQPILLWQCSRIAEYDADAIVYARALDDNSTAPDKYIIGDVSPNRESPMDEIILALLGRQ